MQKLIIQNFNNKRSKKYTHIDISVRPIDFADLSEYEMEREEIKELDEENEGDINGEIPYTKRKKNANNKNEQNMMNRLVMRNESYIFLFFLY